MRPGSAAGSNLSFTYQAAYNAFIRDIEQLDGIGERLVASARGVRGDRITNIAKLGKLKTIEVQIDKLPQAYQDARNKFDAAIDAADSAYVDKVKGLCSYAASTGQGCAGMHYPLEECKAYDRAKGDFKLRRALHAGLVDLTASVADASEKRSPSSEPEILGRLDAISDPEEATAFYNKHQQEILAAFEARKFNNS